MRLVWTYCRNGTADQCKCLGYHYRMPNAVSLLRSGLQLRTLQAVATLCSSNSITVIYDLVKDPDLNACLLFEF